MSEFEAAEIKRCEKEADELIHTNAAEMACNNEAHPLGDNEDEEEGEYEEEECVDDDPFAPVPGESADEITEQQKFGQAIDTYSLKLIRAKGPAGQERKRMTELNKHLLDLKVPGVLATSKQGMKNRHHGVVIFINRQAL